MFSRHFCPKQLDVFVLTWFEVGGSEMNCMVSHCFKRVGAQPAPFWTFFYQQKLRRYSESEPTCCLLFLLCLMPGLLWLLTERVSPKETTTIGQNVLTQHQPCLRVYEFTEAHMQMLTGPKLGRLIMSH